MFSTSVESKHYHNVYDKRFICWKRGGVSGIILVRINFFSFYLGIFPSCNSFRLDVSIRIKFEILEGVNLGMIDFSILPVYSFFSSINSVFLIQKKKRK